MLIRTASIGRAGPPEDTGVDRLSVDDRVDVRTAAVDHQMHVCLRGWLALSFDPAALGVHHNDVAGGHPVVFQPGRGYRDQASGRYPHL